MRSLTQIILSVSESLALMLWKQKTAKDTWYALVTEMTKKPKMVLTSLQCQLRNMKCSEEDDLRQYLDKAQDLFACLNDMGAKMENSEFLDIILGALPPSYELVMNALTTSLEEVGKPIEIDSVIRILKSQYYKKNKVSWEQHQKRCLYALIASEKGILLKISGLKADSKPLMRCGKSVSHIFKGRKFFPTVSKTATSTLLPCLNDWHNL